MSWTEERTERARKLWIEGKSASEIAKAFGDVTKNAVIGRLHRIGVAGPNSNVRRLAMPPQTTRAGGADITGRKKSKPAPRASTAQRPRRASSPIRFDFLGLHAPPAKRTPPQAPPPPAEGIAVAPRLWETRVFGECAFPVSGEGADTLSCCNPTSETYCKAHREIMHGSMPKSWSEYDKERFARKVA